ncbi:MAG: Bax inhibitor-1/YccA family protein [Planctomycetia bacterium]|nr:Bax inhibitor-1/YccA family protein [Planctomycetia bacterium]
MRTSNPALNNQVFARDFSIDSPTTMTLEGTVGKTAALLAIAVATGAYSWNETVQGSNTASLLLIGGAIGGLIASLIAIFKPHTAPWSAPIYAACEGLFLGAISATYEHMYNGIVLQASLLTFGTLGALLLAYTTRLIRATENFKLGVAAATGGIALVYLASFALGMFGIQIPYLHSSGLVGIGISVFIVVVAAMNLVLDFDFIETGVARGAPKFMEWYGAFGLMVTLVWLYIEFLRLLVKLNSRRD